MSAEENKALVRRAFEEVFNRGNIDAVGQFLTPDSLDHNPMPGQPVGSEGLKWVARAMRAAFPDFHFEIHDQVAEGDRVMDRWTISGKHQGEQFGMAPTGKRLAMEGFDMIRIADGKMTEHWAVIDQMGMMQQMGMMPPSAQGGA